MSVDKGVSECVVFSQDPLFLFFFKQTQNEELKVAQGHAAEGAKERLRWEAVEKENSRLKTENERMKKELESFPALQKELETLRSTVTELKVSSGTKGAREEEGRGCGGE